MPFDPRKRTEENKKETPPPTADGDGREFAAGLAGAVKPDTQENPEKPEEGARVAPQSGPPVRGAGKKAKGRPKAKPEVSKPSPPETEEGVKARLQRERANALAAARMRRMRERRRNPGENNVQDDPPRKRVKNNDEKVDYVMVSTIVLGVGLLAVVVWTFREPLLRLFGFEIVNTPQQQEALALPELQRPISV